MSPVTLRKATSAWQQAEADREFWAKNYERMLEEYADHFVAVRGGQVVAAERELPTLVNKLEAQSIDMSDVTVQFVTRDPGSLYL